ncbi:MAG: flagellar export chaperone FliS [Opitutaceae bacterium]|nr:flagellar export chaperone FliS [Opitutaceae bacterium]
MLPAKKLASYRSVSVDTASPGKLILMLFDGALRFLHTAEDGFRQGDLRVRQETVHNNIIKAQNILLELQRCLNVRDGGEFAVNMFRLYDFMLTRLIESNTKKDPEGVRVVIQLLGEIRGAWDEMLQQHSAPAQAAGMSLSA